MNAKELEKIARLLDDQPVPTDHRLIVGSDGSVYCLTCKSTSCLLQGELSFVGYEQT